MADQSNPAAERRTVHLKILTPGTDASSTNLDFPDIPLSASVHFIKHTIRGRLPANPAPERLRLIFLGHRCNDDSTLRDVLGRHFQPTQDTPYIFHLVVTDPHNARLSGPALSQPRASSVPADARNRDGRRPSPGPFQIPRPTPPPGPAPQGVRASNAAATAAMGHPELVNNLLNQHFAHTGQIPQLQNIHNMAQRQMMGMGAGNPAALHQQQVQMAMQQHLQQARSLSQGQHRGDLQAATLSRQGSRRANEQTSPTSIPAPRSSEDLRWTSGQSTSNSPTGQNNAVPAGTTPSQPTQAQPTQIHQPTPNQIPTTPNGQPQWTQGGDGVYNYSTTGVTPNGQQYTVTMRSVPVPAQIGMQPPVAVVPVVPMGPGMFGQPGVQPPFQSPFQNGWPQYPGFGQLGQLDGMQSRRGTPGPQPGHPPFQMPRPVSPYRYGNDENIIRQAEVIAQNAARQARDETSNAQTDGTADTTTPSSTVGSNAIPVSQNPQIYVVTDNGGQPHALLVGPSGPYVTYPLPGDVFSSLAASRLPAEQLSRDFNNFLTAVYRSTFNRMREAHMQSHRQHYPTPTPTTMPLPIPIPIPNQNIPVTPPPEVNFQEGLNAPAGAQPADQNQPQQAAARREPREPDEMRDLLAPVVRNLWLIIQIAGLIYFVGGGTGRIPWRTMAIAGLFLVVWAVQAGHFGDLLGDRVNWLRRYLDHVIGAEDRPNRERNADGAPLNRNAAQAAVDGARTHQHQHHRNLHQRRPQPTPEDAARRLVQDRRDQDAGWVIQQIRSIERTVALLFVSLWPGVGERAVRLQEEREEAARRAAAEAEEQRQRAEEEAAAARLAQEEEAAVAEVVPESSRVVATGVDVGDDGGVERVNKGKQRAATATATDDNGDEEI